MESKLYDHIMANYLTGWSTIHHSREWWIGTENLNNELLLLRTFHYVL